MDTNKRNARKVALTVLALGGATAAVVFGSLAAWTATTTNPGNTVTAGQLTLGNSKDAAAIITTNVTGVLPGSTQSDTVTITNSSTVALTVTATQSAVTDALSDGNNVMKLTIHDDTTGNCVYPSQAGACPTLDNTTANAEWDGSAAGTTNLVNLALPGTGGATWAASEAHTFTVTWEYTDDGTVNNSANDGTSTASFALAWNGA